MTHTRWAWVALGANLGDRLTTLRSAVHCLEHGVPRTRMVAASSVYETRPIGPTEEPFLNAVVQLSTDLEPLTLLRHLQAVEDDHGRTRAIRWGSRTLDLDLLAVHSLDDEAPWRCCTPMLELPHPRAHLRDFVLAPLAELHPALLLDGVRSARQLLDALAGPERTVVRRLPEPLWQPREGPTVDAHTGLENERGRQ